MEYKFELHDKEKDSRSSTTTNNITEINNPKLLARKLLAHLFELSKYDQEIELEPIDESSFRVLTSGKEYFLLKLENKSDNTE